MNHPVTQRLQLSEAAYIPEFRRTGNEDENESVSQNYKLL